MGSKSVVLSEAKDLIAACNRHEVLRCAHDDKDPSGLGAGQKITVTPDDTGKVPVTGTLVGLAADRISIIRSDDQAGDVVVHFPRAGFIVSLSS